MQGSGTAAVLARDCGGSPEELLADLGGKLKCGGGAVLRNRSGGQGACEEEEVLCGGGILSHPACPYL
jgi:hypothetical protein